MPATRRGMAWMAVVVILAIFLAVQFGRQVYANWEIGRQADAVRAEIAALEAENADLRRELEYLNSPAYISAEARRLANLGMPGEQVLIIPEGAEAPPPEELVAVEEPEAYLDQWIALFFGASAGED